MIKRLRLFEVVRSGLNSTLVCDRCVTCHALGLVLLGSSSRPRVASDLGAFSVMVTEVYSTCDLLIASLVAQNLEQVISLRTSMHELCYVAYAVPM